MLEEIITATRRRVADLDPAFLRKAAEEERARPGRSLEAALLAPGMSVIAEIKRRSPSRGELASELDPVAQALRYARGGAAAVSVLTEPSYFSGSLEDLTQVSNAVSVPVLRKDFIVDVAQIWESVVHGADAVLLIVAALDDGKLRRLLAEASSEGLDALVEVHTAAEAERAIGAGARIVGVNNRDLTSFDVDLATAESVAPMLEGAIIRVAESGIHAAADAARMAQAGYDAVLVGEALVRSADPGGLVTELRAATV